jgi:glycosyltransferase involved in cell wall biosynthesis
MISREEQASGVWVVIPAFNEAMSIQEVVAGVRDLGMHCVVVDDGSVDGTAQHARDAGADKIVLHEINRGYSAALASGFRAAAAQPECSWTASVDGDGQIDPADVLPLVRAAEECGAVMGSGLRPRTARRSEYVASWLLGAFVGLRDPLCGLKAYRADFIRDHLDACGRHIGMELAVRAAKTSAGIVQRTIHPRRRLADMSRFGNGLKAELRILRATIALLPLAALGAKPR